MVLLKGVSKIYEGKNRVSALGPVSLTIASGEFVAVMGPSGSGKSTLLNLMGGLDVPTEGAVAVGGVSISSLSEKERSLFRRRAVSYIFQAYHLMPTLTGEQNIALPLHLAGVNRSEIDRRVGEALDEVGLGNRASHLPDELSGGERQRVAIARALVTGAPLLLADEPTGNLDSSKGAEILTLLRRIHDEKNTTIVMVTHDQSAARACERLITLKDGLVVGDGPS